MNSPQTPQTIMFQSANKNRSGMLSVPKSRTSFSNRFPALNANASGPSQHRVFR
jgi:hypothetical protein